MKCVGHGKISLTRTIGHGFPVIELEVDIFQTEDNELKFFYAPDRGNDAHLTIEPQGEEARGDENNE
ncbi:unnamed protein product [marine sediment metagenome]|uniref:Uncharacterized protein n=1 Tax=marine sediment metagenome TaxID=412755 RepID=X1PSQ5_9ZZZZ